MGTRSGWRFKPGSAAYGLYRMRTSRQPNGTGQRRTKRAAPASTRACWPSPWRDAHHLRFAQSRGLSLKVSDEFTVPLCRVHHRELHRTGREPDWWAKAGVEPVSLARKLWLETHPLHASAGVPGDGSDKPGANGVMAMSRQPRGSRMAKRTQLPGTPT